MEQILEELISDFHDRELPSLTRRAVTLPWLSGKIDTVIGMRRSGKTWFLFQIISDLLANQNALGRLIQRRYTPLTRDWFERAREEYLASGAIFSKTSFSWSCDENTMALNITEPKKGMKLIFW